MRRVEQWFSPRPLGVVLNRKERFRQPETTSERGDSEMGCVWVSDISALLSFRLGREVLTEHDEDTATTPGWQERKAPTPCPHPQTFTLHSEFHVAHCDRHDVDMAAMDCTGQHGRRPVGGVLRPGAMETPWGSASLSRIATRSLAMALSVELVLDASVRIRSISCTTR